MSVNSLLSQQTLQSFIRDVPDFPRPGIIFKDITPLLKDPVALKSACVLLGQFFDGDGVDQVIGIESRGFIFASAVATQLGAGFIPVRKRGKLPAECEHVEYTLEYGVDSLEVHLDAIQKGTRVVIIDDLLATGGTARAVVQLIEKLGGKVIGLAFLIELAFLNGREKLKPHPVHTLISF